MLTIRTATEADIDTLINLRLESEEWLLRSGIRQWTNTQRGLNAIRDSVNSGAMRVATHHQTVVASLALNGPDDDFWTPADEPHTGLYLYKFMIGPAWRGTGLGDELLDWACEQARLRGKDWLRLDCWRTNTRLHRYYIRRGFDWVRTVAVDGRGSGALFQRPANSRLVPTRRFVPESALSDGGFACL